jgi:hypothetical protein
MGVRPSEHVLSPSSLLFRVYSLFEKFVCRRCERYLLFPQKNINTSEYFAHQLKAVSMCGKYHVERLGFYVQLHEPFILLFVS